MPIEDIPTPVFDAIYVPAAFTICFIGLVVTMYMILMYMQRINLAADARLKHEKGWIPEDLFVSRNEATERVGGYVASAFVALLVIVYLVSPSQEGDTYKVVVSISIVAIFLIATAIVVATLIENNAAVREIRDEKLAEMPSW